MQLGNPTQPLSTEDPNPENLLPSSDQDFEQGVSSALPANAQSLKELQIVPSKFFKVSDAADVQMGVMARMSQAAFLLGLVHRHNKDPPKVEAERLAEMWQLDRTLRSLLTLTYVEGQIRRMAVCAQTGICYRQVPA
jgi:hypothetical protein